MRRERRGGGEAKEIGRRDKKRKKNGILVQGTEGQNAIGRRSRVVVHFMSSFA